MRACVLLSGACTSPVKRAEEFAAQEDWLAAVMEYRKVYAAHPGDIDYKSRLKQAELKAADFYYQRGQQLLTQGNLDGAIVQFQRGLVSMPEHTKVQQAMADALARKDATALYEEALSLRDAGKSLEAHQRLAQALEEYPQQRPAAAALASLDEQAELQQAEDLALSSAAPIALNFRQTDLKQAFEFLTKSFGVNVIFDESVKSVPVTLFAKDMTFEQGLNLLLATTRTFHKRIGPNTLLIAPDSREKRGQYEDHLLRTFQLNIIRAKEMADILKGLVTAKKLSVNEALNTLMIRDTAEVITLAGRIIEDNDRKPAEIILDVEILEVR